MVVEPTGWYSYDEFTHVFSRLLVPEEYPYIARKISLWRSRAKIPAAMVATESLLSAIVVDQKGTLSESGLSSIYAMAIIRSVNLLLDHEQDREYARSLKVIAKECELPEYIITVRHECSHRGLPDINTLRLTALETINYVYRKYWTAQYKTIMYKLDNEEYEAFSLCCILMSCHSTVLAELPYCIEQHTWKRQYPRRTQIQQVMQDQAFGKAAQTTNLALSQARSRSHLSYCRRRCDSNQAMFSDYKSLRLYELYTSQVGLLAKRLIEGSVKDEYLITALVHFVLPRFNPSPTCLYLVLLLEAIAQMPFNFTVKLVTAILAIVFHLDGRSSAIEQSSNLDPGTLFAKYLSTGGAQYIQAHIGGNGTTSHLMEVESSTASRRVNGWFLALLQWAADFQNNKNCTAPLYTTALACSSDEDGYRMWANAGSALSRITRVALGLLPDCVIQLAAKKQQRDKIYRSKPQPWETDLTSHALGIYLWLRDYSASGWRARYTFAVISDKAKRDLITQLKQEGPGKRADLESLLLPGTFWDRDSWSIRYTVPRLSDVLNPRTEVLETMATMISRVTARMSNKTARRFRRSGRNKTKGPGASDTANRTFLRVVTQLSATSKHMCHRERFS